MSVATFAPKLESTSATGLSYADGCVFGEMETDVLPDGRTSLRIDEWLSEDPGKGHADRALRWLRERFDVIIAYGVGTIDEGVGDISTLYWQRQREKGLVEEIFLDDGTPLPLDNQPVDTPMEPVALDFRAVHAQKAQALLDQHVQPWVDKLPWASEAPVLFNGSEGYAGAGVLGCRSGPADAISFDNLAHEMAHALEIMETKGARALSKPNWGMRIKNTLYVGNQVFREPQTLQPTMRECRVVGIQLHLLEMVGHPDTQNTIKRYAQILNNYMPDWYMGGDNEEDRLRRRRQIIQESYEAWTPTRVEAAWRQIAPLLAALHSPAPARQRMSMR